MIFVQSMAMKIHVFKTVEIHGIMGINTVSFASDASVHRPPMA